VTSQPTPLAALPPQIAQVLHEAPICHVGFVADGRPLVLPALHALVGGTLYIHGSADGALIRAAASGAPLSISAVVLDGIAVGRSACHSALNYRSALLTGRGHPVTDPAEKARALRAITERTTPGGWERGRTPTSEGVAGTPAAAIAIEDATFRSRSGPPHDDEADLALPVWAGEVPLRLVAGPPVPAPGVGPDLKAPAVLGLPSADAT
jgi:nitroimidazol reductase NimA-like FMN-containing flavoprotein (pyridoxamine 5'-phosphate oxidase superfamily)